MPPRRWSGVITRRLALGCGRVSALAAGLPVASRPRPVIGAFGEKIEERVERSRGKVRADVCHQRLMG